MGSERQIAASATLGGGYFPALEVVGLANHVERNGETYGFSVDGVGNPEGEARMEAGYIDGKTSRAP